MRSWNPVRPDGLQPDNPDVTFANSLWSIIEAIEAWG